MEQSTKTIQQVQQHSGVQKGFNFDVITHNALAEISKFFNSVDAPMSLSVIVRRTIRAYLEKVQNLKDETGINKEIVATVKAAKGL